MKITTPAPLSIAILLSMATAGGAQTTPRPAPSWARPAQSRPAPAAVPPAAAVQPPVSQPPGDAAAPAPPPSAAPASVTPPASTSTTTTPSPGTARADAHTANNSPDYRLVPGDKLRIEVYRDAQLSQSLQVRPDGKITMPLIGDIPAEGRTSTELRDALVTSLKEYNTNPVVTVIVVETVPPVFYVMGEVNAPGTFPIKGKVSAVQALAMAGGFKDFAKTKNITVLRKGSGGAQEKLKFNYKDALKGTAETAIYLQPGDTIIVP
jgi:polysaccharide biosynthesis/export protein